MDFRLNLRNQVERSDDIIKDLKNCRIDFSSNAKSPLVTLSFAKKGDALDIEYRVETDMRVLQTGILRVEASEVDKAGKLVAYRLFGIQKTTIGEKLPAVVQEVKKPEKAKPDAAI